MYLFQITSDIGCISQYMLFDVCYQGITLAIFSTQYTICMLFSVVVTKCSALYLIFVSDNIRQAEFHIVLFGVAIKA